MPSIIPILILFACFKAAATDVYPSDMSKGKYAIEKSWEGA